MNYLELLNAFYERIQCSRISNNGQLLYYTLLAINNKSSWSDWFSRTNVSISSLMNVSEKAFMNARAELKQLGLIDFVPSKRRGECTKYRILYPTKYSTKASTNSSTNSSTKEVQSTVQSADIDKQKQKTKTKKSISNEIPEKCGTALPEGIPQKVLDDYIAQLNATGKMMTGPGLELLFKRLEQLAPGNKAQQTEILEQSIRNGWKDIYPLHRKEPKQNQPGKKENPNRFHNFEQRETSYDAVMLERLKERLAAGKSDLPQTGEVKADEAG